MKILVIGGGGREHALIRALKRSGPSDELFALPGNGGIAADAQCVEGISATDIQGIVRFAVKNKMDFVVVTPDDPLSLGAVDALEEAGIPAFGPTRAAARIESSKVFSKDLMRRYHIPTASYAAFSDYEKALAYCQSAAYPLVVKADGLALGKGVTICENAGEAQDALYGCMKGERFGQSGKSVVIEEFLTGPEVSVLSFCDGKTVVPMVSSMDHKRAMDGDQGLNTGGMGAIAPNPFYTPEIAARCMEEIFLPTVRAMEKEGCPFKGCLYFGLMLTKDGPKVIEYNSRFGDPETQVVLPLLRSPLLPILKACREGTLKKEDAVFSGQSACCVVAASQGYPAHYEKGFPITLPESKEEIDIAGAKKDASGALVTSGGRVLGVTSIRDTLPNAIHAAYNEMKKVSFQNMYYRRDIGARALEALASRP